MPWQKNLDLDALVQGVIQGERRSLARALRVVDDAPDLGRQLVSALHTHRRGAQVIGLTGNPGAGKSTLVDQLLIHLRRQNKSVAVLAVDPSSPFSGGAILGDRIRMSRHFQDNDVFIRSLATRGAFGGLSRSCYDSVGILDAAGFDVILLETVGVGQDEVDVVRLVQTTVVVLVPGLGDDIQAFKAGLLEIADIFLLNKADRPGTDELEHSLHLMLSLGPRDLPWQPPIVRSVATDGQGIETLNAAINQHRQYLQGPAGQTQREQWRQERFERLFDTMLVERARGQLAAPLQQARRQVIEQDADPYGVATELLDQFLDT